MGSSELTLSNYGMLSPHLEKLSLLKDLKVLDLSHNKLDKFPIAILSLTYLEKLNLNHNNLISLPSGLGDLPCLRELTFVQNPVDAYFTAIKSFHDIFMLKQYLKSNIDELDWKYIQILFG